MTTSTMEVDVITTTEPDILSVDNAPTPQVLSKYRLAGHFCSTAMKTVIQQCVAGANCRHLCQFGDELIVAQAHVRNRATADAGDSVRALDSRVFS